MTIPNHDTVLIIDFGSQVTQLIARRVRETGVYCEIHPYQKADEAFLKLRPKAIILSGGPDSVTREGSPRAPEAVFQSGLPIMAICYGQQTTAVPPPYSLAAWWKAGTRQSSAARISRSRKPPRFSTSSGKWASAIRSG